MTYNNRPHRLQAAVILAITIDRTLIDCVDESWFTGNARAAFFEMKAACDGKGEGTQCLDRLLALEFGVVRCTDERVRAAMLRRLKMSADKRELLVEYQRKQFQLPKGK